MTKTMRRWLSLFMALLLVWGLASIVYAKDSTDKCTYDLDLSAGQIGAATVKINANKLNIKLRGAQPNTLYTVWIDFRNRALLEAGEDPFPDYPEGAIERGVAPTFGTTAGVKEGMGLDENGVITKSNGDATFKVKLDYRLLQPGDSPVVFMDLDMQGLNRVGGHWMRVYADPNIDAPPSLQVIDPATGLPKMVRGTAQGITIVGHLDFITHGHTPGVSDVDHVGAFKGDFPGKCLGYGH